MMWYHRIRQYGFVEGRDFTTHEVVDGRIRRTDYYGTLSMGKELAMVENNDCGKMIRRYFIVAEEQFCLGRGGGDFARIEQMPRLGRRFTPTAAPRR
jgi:phage anti-repressor protein